MTDERKLELGKRIKEIGEELQRIATEWGKATGLPNVSIEVDGTDNKNTMSVYSSAYLFEADTQGNRRMVGVHEYMNNEENVIENLFMYDRNDITEEEEEDEEGKENTEE